MMFLLSIIILLAGVGASFLIRSNREKKALQEEQQQKRDLLFLKNKMATIYRETAINVALYSDSGERKLLIINGEKRDNETVSGGILCNNLFENPVFTSELAEQLEKEGVLVSDVNTVANLHTTLNTDKQAVYNISIKKLDHNPAYKYIAIAKDITDTIEHKEEKERFEKLIEFATKRSTVGIAYYNIATRKGKATDSWYANLCEEKSGETILPKGDQLPTDVKKQIHTYLESIKSGNREPFSLDFEIQSAVGIKWIREYIFIHQNKGKDNIEIIDLNLDITELKESENILIVLNQQVTEAKKESDKFLNSISHEIRTPLNSIMGFSSLFVNTEDPDDKKEFEEIIRMNINQLIELVNNVILISKLDSHTINIIKEEVQLNKLLTYLQEESIRLLKEDKAYAGKEVVILCDLPEKEHLLNIDRKLFAQVFSNLLSNAMKFTETGSITLGYRENEGTLTFYVKDTGPGIDAKHFEKLFERFEKVDTFTQGTGLGLPLCRNILHCFDSDLQVESQPGKGTTFRFTLKAA